MNQKLLMVFPNNCLNTALDAVCAPGYGAILPKGKKTAFTATTESMECRLCPTGTYSAGGPFAVCRTCPIGTTSLTEGSITAEACTGGCTAEVQHTALALHTSVLKVQRYINKV
jgi:hypothetical protein